MRPPDFSDPELATEAELRRLLGAGSQGHSPADFQDRLRAVFLANSQGGSESQECKAGRSGPPSMSEQEKILRARLPNPVANQEFREELRQRFIAYGSVASREAQIARQLEPRKRGRLFQLGVLAAAAAAIVFVMFYLPDEGQWRVRDPESLGGVLVDGQSLDAGDVGLLAAALRRGTQLVTGPRDLDLQLSLGVRMRVLANSSVEFASLPDAGSRQELGFALERGEVFLETEADFPGHPIRIATEDVDVMVTGTALGVMVDDLGTCTCVEHGEVAVSLARRGAEPVEAVSSGRLLYVMRDDQCMRKDMAANSHRSHAEPLERFAAER